MTDSNRKKVLIIGINYAPELTGIGRYTGEMGDWLTDSGYDCTVVTSYPYYPYWRITSGYTGKFFKREVFKNGKLVLLRCPVFVPHVPTGLKRIIHELSFFASAFFAVTYLMFRKKNQFIICISPPFHIGFLSLYYRFFKGGKTINHIQDLQIEAARDLKVIKADFVFSLMFSAERFILRMMNHVSTISIGMQRKVALKTGKTIEIFPNWVDTDKFYPLDNRNSIKSEWNFQPSDKIILYSGSIGEKQGLEVILDIAEKCLNKPELKFIICGTGPYKEHLHQMAMDRSLVNTFFLPLQKDDVFNKFLNLADVHIIIQKGSAGDLVMPSKLTTILASGGLTIATAHQGTNLYEVIVSNEMGIVIPPEDDELLYNAIVDACTSDYTTARLNARKYAETHLNKNVILSGMSNRMLV